MMPKLPHPAVGREWDEPLYTIEQMEAFARAVAEACASICERLNAGHWREQQCADAIREAAKEIGK